jgi:hypothetical protein
VLSTLKSDLMVSIAASMSSQSSDSVSWTISVRDAGAATNFTERSFRSNSAPLASPFMYVAGILSRAIAAIEEMDTAPRRRSPASP